MKYLMAICMAAVFISCGGEGKKYAEVKVELTSVEKFQQLVEERDVMVVDVRTAEEYAAGFIAGAVNVDVKLADFEKRMNHFDKEVPIAVYCARGKRSAKAAAKLKELGFKQIYDLENGYSAWPHKEE